MKILIINTVPTESNGITNVIFNYLKAFDPANILCDYASINNPDTTFVDIIHEKGGKIFCCSRSFKNLWSYFCNLKNIVSQGRYDAIHIHTNSHTCVLELFAAKMGGCKVRIVHAHSTSCGNLFVHKVLRPLFSSLYTHGLACGQQAGNFMFGSKPFLVMNNGIDIVKYAFDEVVREKIRKQLFVADNEILMGHVGYFLALKNQTWIVDILQQLVLKGRNYKLILIGDGNLKEDIKNQVKQLNLENQVIFTGKVNNVNDYLNAIDIIVMPSLFEGLPLTLIEQQANGLQCVCSDAITTEVDKTGNLMFISLEKSAEEWANLIESFIVLNCRKERSKRAIEDIMKAGYSIQEEATKLIKFYSKCKQSKNGY